MYRILTVRHLWMRPKLPQRDLTKGEGGVNDGLNQYLSRKSLKTDNGESERPRSGE